MTLRSAITGMGLTLLALGSCSIAAPVAAGAPSPTVDTPANGSGTRDPTPLYSGQAGDAVDDSPDVTVRIYSGPDTTGTTVQTVTASRLGTAWSVEGSPALPDGVYTARAEQSDVLNDVGVSAPSTFTIDTTAPDTAVSSGPSGPTNDPTPEFAFQSADAAGFLCRLNAAGQAESSAFVDCASPYKAGALADGAYVFEAAAVDGVGNQDQSPANRSFSVDTAAPQTNITVGPGDTTTGSATFVFSSGDAVGFECRVDAGSWEACVSPESFSGLTLGTHRFEVRGSDAAGNVETTPAGWTWRVLGSGGTIPGVEKQAVALAEDLVRIRKVISHTPMRRLSRRRVVTLRGLRTVTAGTVEFRAIARVRPRRGHFRRVPVLIARRELPRASAYSLAARLTKRGRGLVRRRSQLVVDLRLGFTDRAGRSLWAKAAATLAR